MNDVKIIEEPWGSLTYFYKGGAKRVITADVVAALRAKFAAEQPGRALVQEALDVAHSRSVPLGADAVWHYGALLDKVAGLLTEALAAEQPATPQRPTEDGGVWGSYVAYLAALERQPATPAEQPTPLDPEPWEDAYGHRVIWAAMPYLAFGWEFKPRPEFEQDRARYPKDGA